MKNRIAAMFLTAAILVGLLSGQVPAAENQNTAESIMLSQSEIMLEAGETAVLTAVVRPESAADQLTWVSEDPAVAGVDNGILTAAGAGSTTVSAQIGTLKAVCRVTVTADSEKTGTCPTTIYTGNDRPSILGYLSAIVVDRASVLEYTWSGDDVYVRLAPDTPDDAALWIDFTAGGMAPPFVSDTGVVLSGGSASQDFSAVSTKNWDFTLHFSNAGFAPTLAEGVPGAVTASVYVGEAYTLELDTLFSDLFGKGLTYSVQEADGSCRTLTGSTCTIIADSPGTRVLTFRASNGMLDSEQTYTVTLEAAERTSRDVTVLVPQTITPAFFETAGFDGDGCDIPGQALTAEKGETADGLTAYTVRAGILSETISVRGTDADGIGWGGMAISLAEGDSITLRAVQLGLVDLNGQEIEGTASVGYGPYRAASGEGSRYLLAVDESYEFRSAAADGDYESVTQSQVLEGGADCLTVQLKLGLNHARSITVTTGARAQLYEKVNYYAYSEYEPKIIVDNGDGTTTFHFSAGGSDMSYRVSMEGRITKAGYLAPDETALTVLHADTDAAPDSRPAYAASGQENMGVAEDGVLLNINGRNHLTLHVGDTRTLKAYRAWEIIQSFQNHVIMPDFTYTILSGTDVVSLTPKSSPSNGDGDWMTLTALREGVAVIEVTYDAIEISGGSYDGVHGASDPARSGLVVVQVGTAGADVDFGISCFTSLSSPEADHIPYDPDNERAWDAEFDTLYFTGSSGKLQFKPSGGEITGVAVSNDKGASWTSLAASGGVYTAAIVPGNNILRVTTTTGTAYQVVRGDRITVRCAEVAGASDGDKRLEAGETVRVYLDGLHTPIPKISGNYNPGYEANEDGYSPVHLNYTYDGEAVHGPGRQYDFITAANYVDIILPDDGRTEAVLTDGYIGVGVLGWQDFLNGINGHRYIPDEGCDMLYGYSSFHTRSVLPEITIQINGVSAPNTPPAVKGGAATAGSVELGQHYALNPETLFTDPDGDGLELTVSVNGGAEEPVTAQFKYTPSAVGTHVLTFTASDGEASVSHAITLTVTPKTEVTQRVEFGLAQSEIAGYVYISFEDHGIRVTGETGLKYPAALGTMIAQTRVPFRAGENIAQVTLRLLDARDIGYSYSGTVASNFYLASIKNFTVNNTPYDEMGEFDAGQGSGWMITLNGWFIDKSTSAFDVTDGDVIKWQYTCQVGKDIGDNRYDGTQTGPEFGSTPDNGSTPGAGDQPELPTESGKDDARTIYETTGDYLENLGTPTVNSIGGEWMVLGLARSGRAVPAGYYDNVLEYVRANINEHEQLHRAKSTDNSRVILALTALGRNVSDVDGHDLLQGLTDLDYLRKQGINGPIWALIAFDSGSYPIPTGTVTRQILIDTILAAQLADGGWTLSGAVSDPDMTGMAVQALAPYYQTHGEVKKAVDAAVQAMSAMQDADGGYSSVDGPSSESIAQIIVALCALGIDPDADARFVKGGVSAFDALLTYYVDGGGFRHVQGDGLDGMATEQAYYAMTAYYRMQAGEHGLYDMTDVIDMGGDAVSEVPDDPVEPETQPADGAAADGSGVWLGLIVVVACVDIALVVYINRKKIFKKR